MKTAWIDDRNGIISFTALSGGTVYREEDGKFWQRIYALMRKGYRVQ